jgi:hypothetical protein
MFKLIKVVTITIMGLFMFFQVGTAREFADIYTECGLGAMIAPRNPAVAAVTNVTWDLGTTAISSNISCPDSCGGGKAKLASYIYESYESLEKDLATGNGEYLDGLMGLVQYEDQAKKDLIVILRNDFKDIVADPSYTDKSHFEKAEGLYNLVYKYVDDIS